MMFDNYIDAITKIAESEAFRNLKDSGGIEPATLIMHPKYKKIFVEYCLDVDVIFTTVCPEDKIYMVNDKDIKKKK